MAKNCALLGYYATGSGNLLPTFWDNLSVPFSVFKNLERNWQVVPKRLYVITTTRYVKRRRAQFAPSSWWKSWKSEITQIIVASLRSGYPEYFWVRTSVFSSLPCTDQLWGQSSPLWVFSVPGILVQVTKLSAHVANNSASPIQCGKTLPSASS